MKLTPEERTTYDELAKTHGFRTLVGSIRTCLNAAIRDPSILELTTKIYMRGVSDEEAEVLENLLSIE